MSSGDSQCLLVWPQYFIPNCNCQDINHSIFQGTTKKKYISSFKMFHHHYPHYKDLMTWKVAVTIVCEFDELLPQDRGCWALPAIITITSLSSSPSTASLHFYLPCIQISTPSECEKKTWNQILRFCVFFLVENTSECKKTLSGLGNLCTCRHCRGRRDTERSPEYRYCDFSLAVPTN